MYVYLFIYLFIHKFICLFVPFFFPSHRSWNYNFRGVKHSASMRYSLQLGVPREFYHEIHRPTHFLNFSSLEETEDLVTADREDLFS